MCWTDAEGNEIVCWSLEPDDELLYGGKALEDHIKRMTLKALEEE